MGSGPPQTAPRASVWIKGDVVRYTGSRYSITLKHTCVERRVGASDREQKWRHRWRTLRVVRPRWLITTRHQHQRLRQAGRFRVLFLPPSLFTAVLWWQSHTQRRSSLWMCCIQLDAVS